MRVRIFWTAMVVAIFVAACEDTKLTRPVFVKSQDEAASVMVSAGMPTAWSDIASALQPNFQLTGDQALLQVLPATERIQQQVLNAFGASLGVGFGTLPGTTSVTQGNSIQDVLGTTTPATGGTNTTQTTTTTTNSTESSSSQPVPVPTPPTGIPGAVPALTAPTAAGDIGLDPVLRYRAALDLFESVQLMNRELQQESSLKCYVPFLVRLRITVAAYRPNLGYALNTRISFFPNEGMTGSGTTKLQKVDSPAATAANNNIAADNAGTTADATTAASRSACTDGAYLPQVVPIIAADDIERALKSRATEAAQQIALSLSAMLHGVGGNLGLNNVNQSLQAISSHDFNSRLTIGRQSDNTLFVRVGPTNQATAGMAMTTQNYDIAVLLLAPRIYFGRSDANGTPVANERLDRQIRLVSYTQLRNAFDGSLLQTRSSKALIAEADRVMEENLVGPGLAGQLEQWRALSSADKERVARKLKGEVQASNFPEFQRLLAGANFEDVEGTFSLNAVSGSEPAQSFWASASSLLGDNTFQAAFFMLNWPKKITIPDQGGLLLDDGKTKAQLQLQTLSGNSASTLMASLNGMTAASPPDTGKKFSMPSQVTSLDPTTHLLTLSFPSLAQWGVSNATINNLKIEQISCSTETLCPELEITNPISVVYTKAIDGKDATPSFDFIQSTPQIVRTNGNGTLSVKIAKLSAGETAQLTLSGPADIVSVKDDAGAAVPVVKSAYVVSKDSTILFTLTNLRDGVTLTVTAEGKKDGASTGKKTLNFVVVN